MMEQRRFWEGGGIYRPNDHPVVELFAHQRIRYLTGLGILAGVRTLLDVGAGNGFSSVYYPPEIRVVACDYAAGMLAGNPSREKLLCAAKFLPFANDTFDIVSCWELLHHVDNPVPTLQEMMRVARNHVVAFEPNRLNPAQVCLALARPNERLTWRFSSRYVRRIVSQAGGRIRYHVRCGLLFPNITPSTIAHLLVHLPYRIPLIGISQLFVIEKARAASGRPEP
jgi:SAM-dependent methyltransferase